MPETSTKTDLAANTISKSDILEETSADTFPNLDTYILFGCFFCGAEPNKFKIVVQCLHCSSVFVQGHCSPPPLILHTDFGVTCTRQRFERAELFLYIFFFVCAPLGASTGTSPLSIRNNKWVKWDYQFVGQYEFTPTLGANIS